MANKVIKGLIYIFCAISLLGHQVLFASEIVHEGLDSKDKKHELAVQSPQKCLLMGSKPAIIVKFKDDLSTKAKKRASPINIVESLSSSSKIRFLNPRVIAGGAYVLDISNEKSNTPFSLDKKKSFNNESGLVEIEPGCYSVESVKRIMNQVESQKDVEFITPNTILFATNFEKIEEAPEKKRVSLLSESIHPKQWNLLAPPGGINVQDAWHINQNGNKSAVIAVVDTGVYPHPAFGQNLMQGMRFSEAGGYVNFNGAPPCSAADQKLGCDSDHGTHVAGTVSASGKLAYSQNIYGVAPSNRIFPISILTKATKAEEPFICRDAVCGVMYTADLINALLWLAGEEMPGLKSQNLPKPPREIVGVNLSLGSEQECDIQPILNKLLAKHIAIIVAAGNGKYSDKPEEKFGIDARREIPANCQGVITVAATQKNGHRSYYSNYGIAVDIAAPGGEQALYVTPEIYSYDLEGGIYSTINGTYEYAQGTSMAAPHVAGLVALISSVNPTLSPPDLLELIKDTATPFPAVTDSQKNCVGTKSCGKGIINAGAVVRKAKDQAAMMVWDNRNISISELGKNKAKISWREAEWLPRRQMPIVYTVNVNGMDVPECTHITSTFCELKELKPKGHFSVFVKATDSRNLYKTEKTPEVHFSTPDQGASLKPPTILAAVRGESKGIVRILYKDPGSFNQGCFYTAKLIRFNKVIPVLKRDATKRFILKGVPNMNSNVMIYLNCGKETATSNVLLIRKK